MSDPPPEDEKAWWLPVFPDHHLKKGKIYLFLTTLCSIWKLASIQFFSKVQTEITVSAASCLDSGKREMVFMADIKSIFHRFQVAPEYHDHLCSFDSKIMILSRLSLNIVILSTSLARFQVCQWLIMV